MRKRLIKFDLKPKREKMKVLIEIPDDEASFGMKVLKSLSFVKKAKPISVENIGLWEDLNEAAVEVSVYTSKGKSS